MVAEVIKDLKIPIVLDPVSISKVSSPLLQESAIEAMSSLFDLVTVITPNAFEAYELFGYKHQNENSLDKIQQCNTPV